MLSRACGRSIAVLVAVVLTIPAMTFAGSSIQRVRYSINPDYSRIVLDTSTRCSYKVSGHKNPDRIAINIRGVSAGSSLKAVTIERGGVKRVRVNRLSWGTQVVIDLDGPAKWEDFRLAGAKGKSERIVIDVMPGQSPFPRVANKTTPSPSAQASIKNTSRPFTVAIDAGHGGKDNGTLGRYGLVEKNLTLDLAKRLAAEINRHSGLKAVLTRKSDRYLTLPRRTQIAKELGADAFVSIHLNSAPNRRARGAEVYFVSPAGAARSASKLLSNPDRVAHDYGLQDNDTDILKMLVDMNQQSVLARSEMLAESILNAINRRQLMPTRSVKQKSFSVLRTIAMPSVLVEAGFISNSADAKLIRKAAERDKVAKAMSAGVISFFSKHPPVRAKKEPVIVHRVKSGETLWKISRKYGTSVASLRQTNKLGRASVLHVGQELLVSKGY